MYSKQRFTLSRRSEENIKCVASQHWMLLGLKHGLEWLLNSASTAGGPALQEADASSARSCGLEPGFRTSVTAERIREASSVNLKSKLTNVYMILTTTRQNCAISLQCIV